MFELVIPPKQIVEHIRHATTDSRASKFEVNSHEVPQDLCGNHEANPTRPTPEILLIMTQCRRRADKNNIREKVSGKQSIHVRGNSENEIEGRG